MSTVLAYLNLYVITGAAAFLAGVVFSQKVKDWAAGIPGDIRRELQKLEATAVARVRAAQMSALAAVIPDPAKAPIEPPKA